MEIVHVKTVEKKIVPGHGETSLYQQIFGIASSKPNLTKNLSLWFMTFAPGADNKRHVHEGQEQVYLILEGEGVMEVGEERKEVKAWDAIYLPPKLPHAFYNNPKTMSLVMGISVTVPV